MSRFKKVFSVISIIFNLFFLIQISEASQFRQNVQSVNAQRSVEQDGSDVITITSSDNQTIKFTYKNNLLARKKVGNTNVAYQYNSNGQMAYATINDGSSYSLTRDRAGRIVSISGSKNVEFEVSYVGDSIVPDLISVSLSNGQKYYPSFFTSQEKIDLAISSDIRKIDQRLALIYEFNILHKVESGTPEESSNNGVIENPAVAGNGAISANTTCSGCYTIYLMDIDCCNRTYYGLTPIQNRNRQMCYEGAMQYYADCLRNCT